MDANSAAPPTEPNLAAPPVEAPRPVADSVSSAAHALAVGTEIRTKLEDSIHSLRNSEGQRVTATVSGDLRAPDGTVLVPSGF